MGASSREIERQIKETRARMDANLSRLEDRAASNAVRYGTIAAIGLGALAIGGVAFLVYRRKRGHQLKVRRVEKKPAQRGALARIVRVVAPAVAATASRALFQRLSRSRAA
jgi:hypothetical protein